jgi:SAM-dependent methyltransferase
MTTHEPYRKAAGTDRLASHYDLMARLGMRERHLKGRVIELAQLKAGQRLLDLGCGTGTLLLMASRRHPDATVIGVDGDPTILGIARRKARREGVAVQLDEGMAYALPYADGSFDAVVSTLTFHHLTPDQQERTLAEVRRVLRPGGRLVIADLAPPHNPIMRLLQQIPLGRLLHGWWGGSRHAHDEMRVEQPPAAPAHSTTGTQPDTAPDSGRHGAAQLDNLLAANDWRSVAPVCCFMSLMGTIAVHALTRPG